jgi:hypothetical protein
VLVPVSKWPCRFLRRSSWTSLRRIVNQPRNILFRINPIEGPVLCICKIFACINKFLQVHLKQFVINLLTARKQICDLHVFQHTKFIAMSKTQVYLQVP